MNMYECIREETQIETIRERERTKHSVTDCIRNAGHRMCKNMATRDVVIRNLETLPQPPSEDSFAQDTGLHT